MPMGKVWSRAFVVGLTLIALPTLAVAEDGKVGKSSGSGGLWSLFTGEESKRSGVLIPGESIEKPQISSEDAATIRAKEEAAYFRRIAVCDKLMTFALEHENARLQKRVEELERRAWKLYVARTSRLAIGGADAPSDEQRLADELAPNRQRDVKKLVADPKPEKSESRGGWAGLRWLRGGER